jgi:hypothetical protein
VIPEDEDLLKFLFTFREVLCSLASEKRGLTASIEDCCSLTQEQEVYGFLLFFDLLTHPVDILNEADV